MKIPSLAEIEAQLMALSDEQKKALEAQISNPPNAQRDLIPIDQNAKSAPLSFIQESIWFLNEYTGASPAYRYPLAVKITGKLDLDKLKHGIQSVAKQHGLLRSRFPLLNGQAIQELGAYPVDSFTIEETTLPLESLIQTDIDLKKGPCLAPFELTSFG